jgi:hypothetical protein
VNWIQFEFRNVRTWAQFNSQFSAMLRFVIILCEPLADFPCDHSHKWVGIEIVVGLTAKRLNPNRPLLQSVLLSPNDLMYHITKKLGISVAMAKEGTALNPL